MFADRILNCIQCRTEFVFSAAEQQFFDERGFRFAPRRCKGCRLTRRGKTAAAAGAEGQPRGASGRTPREGDRPRHVSDRPAFPATCSSCGAATTVPFKPDPARAAFCRGCYSERRNATR